MHFTPTSPPRHVTTTRDRHFFACTLVVDERFLLYRLIVSMVRKDSADYAETARSMKNSKSAQMLRQADRSSPSRGTKAQHTPHSPRRQKLNLRMKSLSLDSPECGELRRRPARDAQPAQGRVLCTCRSLCMRHGSSRAPNGMAQYKARSSPSSPVHSRRLLSTRGGRMSSVELPDEHDKSLSSNSASPCPSPVKQLSKHQRLLPTNLYVILYNFKSRHADELDLKAGYKVTVIDTSDPDWWKGKCLGKIGYFPSKYCTKLQAGERPLQVTHNLQVSDGDNGLMLLRDQIVIQVGDEVDGMVMIRSGDNRQGVCPVKFLQERLPFQEYLSPSEESYIYADLQVHSEPNSPCDSELFNICSNGLWWWRRPLDVRRPRLVPSSAARPLRVAQRDQDLGHSHRHDYDKSSQRPLSSHARPLLFAK
ncbi:SH3 and cysteine-rich domain-containing protein 3 [Eumeta japonica]|uniref:SH3 and cysteine-rich domain-containing protein 3 n=1 Tax=Eumeta variegata TaxID=151549 RepID=A0A4C1TKL8_EUMVA|nr:SH3 and cysteine-rich domain-containing protein 3 [Eumeta japonica]